MHDEMEPKAEGLTSERAAPPRLGRRGEEPFQDPETNEQEEGATMDSEPTPSTSSHPPRHEAKVDPSHRRVGFFDGRETKGGNDDAPDDARGAGGGPTEDDAALESNADEEVSSLHHSARSSLPQSSPSCREGGSSEVSAFYGVSPLCCRQDTAFGAVNNRQRLRFHRIKLFQSVVQAKRVLLDFTDARMLPFLLFTLLLAYAGGKRGRNGLHERGVQPFGQGSTACQ